MVTRLLTILLAILITGVIVYAIDLIGLDGRIAMMVKLIVVVLAIVVVAQRLGAI